MILRLAKRLLSIAQNESNVEHTQAEIAEIMAVTRISISKSLKTLEDLGLVKRTQRSLIKVNIDAMTIGWPSKRPDNYRQRARLRRQPPHIIRLISAPLRPQLGAKQLRKPKTFNQFMCDFIRNMLEFRSKYAKGAEKIRNIFKVRHTDILFGH